MPKVVNPLHSEQASGQLGHAVVYARRKGQNVVRSWAKPANPMLDVQGDQRLVIGGLGRAASGVKKGSDYATKLVTLNVIPAVQTKQSYIVQKIFDSLMPTIADFQTERSAFEAHAHKDVFTSAAASIALTDFSMTYGTTNYSFSKGLMLYEIAKLGIELAFGVAPFTTAIASWNTTEVNELLAYIAAV